MPAILRLPDVRPLRPYIILPRPNVIDKWLFENHIDTVLNVFADSYHASLTGDVPSDHVSCTLQLSTILVIYYLEFYLIMHLILFAEV
jgi:hypothetical protein